MLDVHAPQHTAGSFRDFLIHISTIVVGLLIAIGLEQTVEHFHNRHLLHHTEANLREEMQQNRKRMTDDEKHLDSTEEHIEENLTKLAAAQAHQPVLGDLHAGWEWDSPEETAWETAKNNGAVALMPYEISETWSTVYSQQATVDAQTVLWIRDIYRVYGPLSRNRTVSDLRPEELAAMTADAHQLLADLRLLRDLSQSLDRVYARATPIVGSDR